MSHALQLTGLTRTFGQTTVLSNLDLTLERGDRLAVVGSSGSGKTTLLRLIAGLDTPTAGSIAIAGRSVSTAGRLHVPPQRRGVAMVFQGLALFPHLRALDQIAYAARGANGRSHAKRLLDAVDLGHRANAPLDELSGGERQRIALARALAQEPALILMDEPFASLDDQKRAEMRGLLKSLLDGIDATLILVTHSRDDALDLGRRVLVLDHGQAVASDTLAGVLANPQHAAAVRCLGLGQIIRGQSIDGDQAQTAFGRVALARSAPLGLTQLLVRPAQLRVSADGVTAEIIAVEWRVPESTSHPRQIVVVRIGEEVLRVEANETVAAGQSLRVRINGACQPLVG